MTDSHETIGRHFDTYAKGYNERAAEQWRTNEIFGRMLGSLACAPESYLDIGAGAGATIVETLKHATPQRVVAVDASGKMVASLGNLDSKVSNFSAVQAGAMEYLKTASESFDLVSAISVIPFVEDTEELLQGVAQRMSSEGLFVFTYDPLDEANPLQSAERETVSNTTAGTEVTIHRQRPEDMEAIVARAGLAVIEHELFLPSKTRNDLVARIVTTTSSH